MVKVGNEEYILGSTGIPARARDANVPWKALRVRCQVNDAASSASIAATLDNIERNGFTYDDFSSWIIARISPRIIKEELLKN